MSRQTERTVPRALHVLYDGGCPLCRREIAIYRRLRPRRPVQWVDIDADRTAPTRYGLSRPEAMARFHVIDGDRVDTGAAAFVTLWGALPAWRHLAAVVRALRLLPVLEWGYGWFARHRTRGRCTDEGCRVS